MSVIAYYSASGIPVYIRKETEHSLEYKIRNGLYGFRQGLWQDITRLTAIHIEFYIAPERDKFFEDAIAGNDPLLNTLGWRKQYGQTRTSN